MNLLFDGWSHERREPPCHHLQQITMELLHLRTPAPRIIVFRRFEFNEHSAATCRRNTIYSFGMKLTRVEGEKKKKKTAERSNYFSPFHIDIVVHLTWRFL